MWPQEEQATPWVWAPPPTPSWKERLIRPAIAAAAVVGAVGALAVVGGSSDPYPDAWDERVRPLVRFVESARGGRFDHPVEVRFLTAEEYARETRVDAADLDEEDTTGLADDASYLRALGLLQGDVDLLSAGNEVADAGTLAFYDPITDVVVVRGTEVTTDLEVTLVHELTHAWQDQRHEIGDLYVQAGDDATAIRGLLEGDAIRIEQAYIATELSPAEQDAYFAGAQAGADEAGAHLADLPDILVASFDAPYLLGIPFVLTLDGLGGGLLDEAFGDPPSSDEQLMDVLAYLADDEPVEVDLPTVDVPKEDIIGTEPGLGALGLYLVLAERLDTATALVAVEGWGGDAVVHYRKGDRTCVRADFAADTEADLAELRAALAAWAAALPAGVATVVDATAGLVGFDTCDPGPEVDLGVTGRSSAAVGVLTARSFVLRELLAAGFERDAAGCVARAAALALTPEQAADFFSIFGTDTLGAVIESAYAPCGV